MDTYAPTFPGWPSPAQKVFEQAIERQGGWARWRTFQSVTLTLDSLGGPLPWAKGLARVVLPRLRLRVEPHAVRARFFDYPSPGFDGVFEHGAVRLVEHVGGRVLAESLDHRRTFVGGSRHRRWDALDALYFFGYATSTYFAVPFLLASLSFVGLRRVRASGESWCGLTVAFPPGYPTHSRHQTFFFDGTGLLRRHDYVAEVVGSWARGAHFSDDYEAVDGLLFARRRSVRATLLGRPTPLPVLNARLSGFRVNAPE
jgi:hypothetical protein